MGKPGPFSPFFLSVRRWIGTSATWAAGGTGVPDGASARPKSINGLLIPGEAASYDALPQEEHDCSLPVAKCRRSSTARVVWATALGLTGWGLAVADIGDVRPPDIDTAGAYLAGAGLAGVVAVVLRRRGFRISDLGFARPWLWAVSRLRSYHARKERSTTRCARCGWCPQRGRRRLPDGPRDRPRRPR